METVRIEEMFLRGGHPALDFVNTLGGFPTAPVEHLLDYEDLLVFGVRGGTLSERAVARLQRSAARQPDKAQAALDFAQDLRRLTDDAFRPLANGDPAPSRALEGLRDAERTALGQAALVREGAGFRWSWEHADELEAPLWPLAHGAVELLTSESLDRLKPCARCRWLYLDLSKNRSRRWCSMENCGTDDKKERYLKRRRERRS